MSTIEIDKSDCIQCGLCASVCPSVLLQQRNVRSCPEVVDGAESRCINCGHCVAICPVNAIAVNGITTRECVPVSREASPRFEHIASLVRNRRSIRKFVYEPLDRTQLDQLFDVVRYAPTARNGLPVRWTVVNSPKTVNELAELVIDWIKRTGQSPELVEEWNAGHDRVLRGAPCLVVATTNDTAILPEIDSTIAVEIFELAATALRIGVCWAGYFVLAAQNDEAIVKRLKLDHGERVYGALMLGKTDIEIYPRVPVRPQPVVRWL
ncbi:MAG: nitroreductase family protein [Planctomycetaceae bacterium]|jgi:nitroreductase/NAD-dependent dihydropyrimidine dehydrogenase PreA subunit|nr:nitroreductase family protein [Planctomycetaceae bacterium]